MSNLIICPDCSKEISKNASTCPNCGRVLNPDKKNKIVAALLAFFLGGFGAQWFYLGKTMYGVISLLLFWTCIPAIVSFVHFILLLISSEAEFDIKYNS